MLPEAEILPESPVNNCFLVYRDTNQYLEYAWNKMTMNSLDKMDKLFLSHLYPLPCGAGSTVPREGFDSSVIMPFSRCVVTVTLPTSSVKPPYIHFRCVAGIHGGCG